MKLAASLELEKCLNWSPSVLHTVELWQPNQAHANNNLCTSLHDNNSSSSSSSSSSGSRGQKSQAMSIGLKRENCNTGIREGARAKALFRMQCKEPNIPISAAQSRT